MVRLFLKGNMIGGKLIIVMLFTSRLGSGIRYFFFFFLLGLALHGWDTLDLGFDGAGSGKGRSGLV